MHLSPKAQEVTALLDRDQGQQDGRRGAECHFIFLSCFNRFSGTVRRASSAERYLPCQQCSNAVSHVEFEMEDAAAGLELVFSTLFCKQNGSCNEYYVDRLTSAYSEKKYTMWCTVVFCGCQLCAAWPQVCQPSEAALHWKNRHQRLVLLLIQWVGEGNGR